MKTGHIVIGIAVVCILIGVVGMTLSSPIDYVIQLKTLGYDLVNTHTYQCPVNPFTEYVTVDDWNEFRAILARSRLGGCDVPDFIEYDKVLVSYDMDWIAFGTTDEIIYIFNIGE